jgi:hypothetical protein
MVDMAFGQQFLSTTTAKDGSDFYPAKSNHFQIRISEPHSLLPGIWFTQVDSYLPMTISCNIVMGEYGLRVDQSQINPTTRVPL